MKARKFINTPSTKLKTVKILSSSSASTSRRRCRPARRRHRFKQPGGAANSHPCSQAQTPATSAGPESKASICVPMTITCQPSGASSVPGGTSDADIADAINQYMVGEGNVSCMKSFFKFGSARSSHGNFDIGSLEFVVALVAEAFPKVQSQIGEPRALSLYGAISGILQKMPPSQRYSPDFVFVSAFFYIGWELIGSWETQAPSIIMDSPKDAVLEKVYKILGWMAAT